MRLTLKDCHRVESPVRDPVLVGLVMTPCFGFSWTGESCDAHLRVGRFETYCKYMDITHLGQT